MPLGGFVHSVSIWEKNVPDLFQLLAVSAVVMGMAHTITKERVFAAVRERLGGHDTFFGYLFSCPYCMSHWLAFFIVPLTGTYAIDVALQWEPLDKFLTWFFSCILVTVITAFMRVAFYFVDETQALVRGRKRRVEVLTTQEEQMQ
jgi:Mn2+/Fe2+ NRAMP family transporter